MNNKQLSVLLKDLLGEVKGDFGHWELYLKGVSIVCYTDEMHNRMRLVAPILPLKELTVGHMKKCMEANFHTTIDVKYAFNEGNLVAIYVHPFKELLSSQLKDAVRQIYSAVRTYGTSYSAGELKFPTKNEIRRGLN